MKSNDLTRYSISMEEFLINYMGLDYMIGTETFDNLVKASHQDLTELGLEGIKRLPYECVSLSDIMEGTVVIVRSGKKKGDIAPYRRPSLVLDNISNKTK